MCSVRALWPAAECIVVLARGLAGQSTAEYRARVDSLAKLWRPMIATEAAHSAGRAVTPLPRDSARFGNVIVRADSGYEKVSHTAAEHLAPRVEAAYGGFAASVARYQFVVKRLSAKPNTNAVSTGVADSLGAVTLR